MGISPPFVQKETVRRASMRLHGKEKKPGF